MFNLARFLQNSKVTFNYMDANSLNRSWFQTEALALLSECGSGRLAKKVAYKVYQPEIAFSIEEQLEFLEHVYSDLESNDILEDY